MSFSLANLDLRYEPFPIGVARPIMPPMPWQAIGTLPDSDLRAMYAYLMAQPAVKNKVPEYAPPATATAGAGTGRIPG